MRTDAIVINRIRKPSKTTASPSLPPPPNAAILRNQRQQHQQPPPLVPSFESHRLRKPTGGLISPSWDPLALTRAALQSSSKNAGHHTGHQKRPRQRVSATVKLLISLETGVNLGPSVGTSGSPGHQLLQINPRNPLLSNDILSRLSRETTTAVL